MRDNGTGFVLFHGRKCSIKLVFELLLMAVPSLLSMLTDTIVWHVFWPSQSENDLHEAPDG
jgi:hypothetical protein